MSAITKRTYTLGWIFFLIALIERLLITRENILNMAIMHNVWPRNFLQLSFLFFVIAIASRACCTAEKAQ